MVYPLRIFISYSHEDTELASKAAEILSGIGYVPIWDKHIRPGIAFTEEIKQLILHAHIFLPLLTKNSASRPWVHQETGYAAALNIPILPVAIGAVPGEMVAQLQAVVVQPDLADLHEKITAINLEQIVLSPKGTLLQNVEISDWPERRAELLAQNCRIVAELGNFGRVRQRAALSSFSIPDKDVSDEIWDRRDGDFKRSPYYHNRLLIERLSLEQHAREAGCSLIIDPDFCLERNGRTATNVRLEILLEFLESMPDEKVSVVVSRQARGGNLTLVGDWFSAESVSPRAGEGHRQTVFTWHPPTVLGVMQKFDKQFGEIAKEQGGDLGTSRQQVIKRIKEILTEQKA